MLQELLNRVQKLNDGLQSGDIVRGVVSSHKNDILDSQKQQLFAGKTSEGDDFRPYYSEDLQPSGYFKSKESAERYSAWKQTLNYPYSVDRNPDAPNLYINGKFHSELKVQFGKDAVVIEGGTTYANNIVRKYGLKEFGLTADNWNNIFFDKGGYNELMDGVKKVLFS